ncbi:PREDICTED: uncharacterized protein LOC104596058 isoform X2 [Nelumbo nucifera]|uniref:Uncharacterized protein LOC104596058 isoform X2 n=1 Tax=Nelumbo nucifera TaxID=4432 RepID=A0A1U8A2I1_NELNU|nr:PREDICTED: uncharacterized protein LOC104596058 isoform X2 [Nelumbo nucifera]
MERGTNTASTTMDNPIADPDRDSIPMPIQNNPDSHESRFEPKPLLDQNELLKAIEIVEKDSLAIAESFTSLFSSLRLALSQATNNSIDHMQCFSDVVGRLQESALDAATRGNRYINSCLRLNEEMKGIENLAVQLSNVDALDSAVNRLI